MGRVILITGASSGFGKSSAVYLAALGHRVYGTSRRASMPLPQEPASFPLSLRMDVDDEQSVQAAVAFLLEREGRIDVVVNNAGVGIAGAVEATSSEEAKALFETNFFGAHRVCRAVLPAMRAQGSGTIVNISSLAGRLTVPFQGFYSASKYALEAMTEALRMEVAPFGIRVTMVEPGDFKTGFTEARTFAADGARAEPYQDRCLRAVAVMEHDEQHGADPEDVARLLGRMIERDRPALRYPVGMLLQRALVGLKRALPAGAIEAGLKAYYKV